MIPDPHDDIRWCYDLLKRSEVREDDYEHALSVLDAGLCGSERPVAREAWRALYGFGCGGAFAPVFRRVIRCQGILAQHVADLEAALEEVA